MAKTQQGAIRWQKRFVGCKQGIAFNIIQEDTSFARR